MCIRDRSWWEQVFALANNHICSYKTYSQNDLDYTNFIGRYVTSLGKPLSNEEFGAEHSLGDTVYAGTPWNGVALSMADYCREVYRRGWENGATSFIFWNLGYEDVNSNGFDIAPTHHTGTFAVVTEAASSQSPLSLTVDGQALTDDLYLNGALTLKLAINQRSQSDLALIDVLGANHFDQGAPMVVSDDFGRSIFGGVITHVLENQVAPTAEDDGDL